MNAISYENLYNSHSIQLKSNKFYDPICIFTPEGPTDQRIDKQHFYLFEPPLPPSQYATSGEYKRR